MESEKDLTKTAALRAYARMMHHLSAEYLAPLLADDFHYASQWVFEEIESKQQYLAHLSLWSLNQGSVGLPLRE